MDSRIKILAKNLVAYSCEIKEGEKVLIECYGDSPKLLVKALIKEIHNKKAYPFVTLKDNGIQRELLLEGSKQLYDSMAKYELERMKEMDAYIGIRGHNNVNELSDIDSKNMNEYMMYFSKPVHGIERVNNTRWVVLRYPNESMAQMSNMSLEKFEDFYFNVCNLDYNKMSKAMDNLVALMNKTDKVKIIGKGTNLEFSIKDIPAIKCDGKMNIPDGEVFSAPVKNSINGTLHYNTFANYQGTKFDNIKLEFKDGKIINATANETKKINEIFDTDEGARYVGEFAIGVNPYILNPMGDTLFDEKIMGSFHFTPGQCYEEAPNGNDSAIHWDLVCIQTKEYGGGEIYFDDVLIRKDGIFVVEELEALNPKNLM